MRKLWKPALFFVLVLLAALLINMPLAHLLGVVRMPDNIRIFQPQGSLISGRIGGIEINQFLLRDLEYEADLSCLLTLGVCYQVLNPYGSLQVRHEPLAGSTELTQVKIEYPLQDLTRMPGVLMQPAGRLQLNLDSVLIVQDKLADLNGTLVWKDAGLAGEDINLGDYEVSVGKAGGRYEFVIDDKDAVLDMAGKASLQADGKYTLDITIRTKSGLEPRIRNALELVARKQGANQYVVRRAGSLDPALLANLMFTYQ
ncbi:MAG: type II secretion system protein N [Proteobacteria bacterium]|nr:type II secretion system protein N [Pseudomonadota bacterium]